MQLLTSTRIAAAETSHGRISALGLESQAGARRLAVSSVLWTSPPQILLALLGAAPGAEPDAPVPHRIVHLFLDAPPATGPLYWLWSYDPGNSLVRVSNPAAYCPDAAAGGLHPVCVELHVDSAASDDASVIARAEAEMRAARMIPAGARVAGAAVLPGYRGLPVPTLGNCAAMHAQRRALEGLRPANLALSTQDMSSGMFYLADILAASKRILDAVP